MAYQKGLVYHIYNQGNNQQGIFFERENYLFFLRKMRKHLLPYADVLCYCLMPNHFHWLLMPNDLGVSSGTAVKPQSFSTLRQITGTSEVPAISQRQQLLSQHIGILLSSYSKAINKRYGRSGSLFRGNTKSKHGMIDDFVTETGKHQRQFFQMGNHYAISCFKYIHNNPVEAKLVLCPEDWEYSSARDFADLRKGTLCNYQLAREMLNGQ